MTLECYRGQIGKDGKNRLEIFRYNPGKEKVMFPPKHPYYPQHCNGEKLNMSGLIGYSRVILAEENDRCKAKKVLEGMEQKEKKAKRDKATAEVKRWLDDNVTEEYYADNDSLKTGKLYISKGTIMDVADHWANPELKLMAKDLPNIKEFHWFEHSDLNEQKDNLGAKQKRGVTGYNYYTFIWEGNTYTLNTEVIYDKFEKIHAVNFYHKKFLKNKK